MIDNFAISCSDFARSREFYDRVLGYSRQMDWGPAIGYGRDGHPDVWITDANLAPNREFHVAFRAANTDAVRAFHDTALGLGDESLHSARLWPEYRPGYFGAFVRDPQGNNVEAVFHGVSAATARAES
jgi:catechol 2,3-dioxygenase-like lactoylglutathione lyase family enzyme